jgi:hypothetical protein
VPVAAPEYEGAAGVRRRCVGERRRPAPVGALELVVQGVGVFVALELVVHWVVGLVGEALVQGVGSRSRHA